MSIARGEGNEPAQGHFPACFLNMRWTWQAAHSSQRRARLLAGHESTRRRLGHSIPKGEEGYRVTLGQPERTDVHAMSHPSDERGLVLPRRLSGHKPSRGGTRLGRDSRAHGQPAPVGDVAAPSLALGGGEGVERFEDTQVGARHHVG